MRAHYLQHVPFEELGSIETWLNNKGYEISSTRFFKNHDLPDPHKINFLIVLGGPMSVNDDKEYPWMTAEKKFIRDVIELQIPILGICLGAQLIASALGSNVYSNPKKEIGWFPVEGVPVDASKKFQFPSSFECFHWHGETFDLPEDSVLLAKSKACNNQAFQLGSFVIGLQFHLETTPEAAKKLVRNCRQELAASQFIQTEKEILAVDSQSYRQINSLMSQVLTFLHENNYYLKVLSKCGKNKKRCP